MTRRYESHLNQFVLSLPPGVALTSKWLEQQGISPKLAWWYVRSGLIERMGPKIYKKTGEVISWVGLVCALQDQLHLPIHVGGKTALQLLGRFHSIPMQGIRQIVLFADLGTRIPTWLSSLEIRDVHFEIFRTSLFKSEDASFGIIEKAIEGINLHVSCPERAALEALYLFPKYETLHEVELLMENLGQSRPAVVQSLLEQCNSIKAKRLLLYFAEQLQHAWVADLDLDKINLGHGKRVIGKGGEYNAKYRLSLPKKSR